MSDKDLRERLERQLRKDLFEAHEITLPGSAYEEAVDALHSELSDAGYAVVPIYATDAMLDAAYAAQENEGDPDVVKDAANIWDAMLAASKEEGS